MLRLSVPVTWVALVFAVCWPVVPSLQHRWFSSAGWWPGAFLFAIAVAAWISRLARTPESGARLGRVAPSWAFLASALLIAYGVFQSHAPSLITCLLVLSASGSVMLGALAPEIRRRSWALLPMLWCSLHLTPSLDFFLGYPLRQVTAHLAALLLGGAVEVAGVGLSDGTHTVFVDAPCSGLRMLTVALILASSLSWLFQLPRWGLCLTLAAAGLLAILGNALRAAALLQMEVTTISGSVHDALGVVIFAGCAFLLLCMIGWLTSFTHGKTSAPNGSRANSRLRYTATVVFVLAGLFTSARSIEWSGRLAPATAVRVAITIPSAWEGVPLARVPLDSGTERFLNQFPGHIQQYRLGETGTRVLIRQCNDVSRALHPSEDCYRGTGWKCDPLPAVMDADGHLWTRFRAVRPNRTAVTVRQCFFLAPAATEAADLSGVLRDSMSWPDASSWYWGADHRNGEKVTLAVTVAE